MKSRPWPLNTIAIGLFVISLSIPIQAIVIFDFAFSETLIAARNITTLNWFIIFSLLAQVPLILKANKLLFLTMPFSIGLVAFNNYLVGVSGLTVDVLTAVLATVGFIGLSGLLLHPKAMEVFKEPKKRKWLQRERAKVKIPMKINYFRGAHESLTTFDISESGAFLVGNDDTDWLNDFDIGSEINFKITSDDLIYVKSVAKVVRKDEANGQYPRGIGVEFQGLTKAQKGIITNVLMA